MEIKKKHLIWLFPVIFLFLSIFVLISKNYYDFLFEEYLESVKYKCSVYSNNKDYFFTRCKGDFSEDIEEKLTAGNFVCELGVEEGVVFNRCNRQVSDLKKVENFFNKERSCSLNTHPFLQKEMFKLRFGKNNKFVKELPESNSSENIWRYKKLKIVGDYKFNENEKYVVLNPNGYVSKWIKDRKLPDYLDKDDYLKVINFNSNEEAVISLKSGNMIKKYVCK